MVSKYEVIGFSSRSGEFEGRHFDNVLVHCVRPARSELETGSVCETFKIRRSDFNDCKSVSVGDEVTPYFDRYGRVVALI